MPAPKAEVVVFLGEFKQLMDEPGSYIKKKHEKTKQALERYGLTYKNLDDEIKSLSISNYSNGPCSDNFGRGNYWVFGAIISNVEFYIKLQIQTSRSGEDTAVCLSFHPAEYNLNYPYRQMIN